MVGEIVHVELPSRDFVRSATFYSKLFGWKTDGIQSGGHLLLDLPGGIQGSLVRDALAHAPGPVPFVAVSDVDKTLAEAVKQGGRILVQRLTLPGKGFFGLLADHDGNIIGVLSSGTATAKTDKPARSEKAETPAKSAPAPASAPAAAPKGAAKIGATKKTPRKR